jgi:selenocysteine lyase/cysteine desulfurase
MVAAALPLSSGDNVLVCDLEFFPSALCWRARAEAIDLEVRPVRTAGGRVGAVDFERHLDERTKAIVVSAVQEINGFRAPLADLCRMAHAAGVMVIVDGVQEVGCLNIDLGGAYDECPDVYCAGGHKWLCNPFGVGFMCVHARALDLLKPAFYGYFNAAEPDDGWGSYLASPERTPFDPLPLLPGAQRFESGGMGNFLGAAVLGANLEALLARGMDRVEAEVKSLGERLVEGIEGLGLEVRCSLVGAERSGITVFGLPGGFQAELELNDYLASHGVYVSVRYTSGVGGVRVSPHVHNDSVDVDRLLEATETWLGFAKYSRQESREGL